MKLSWRKILREILCFGQLICIWSALGGAIFAICSRQPEQMWSGLAFYVSASAGFILLLELEKKMH